MVDSDDLITNKFVTHRIFRPFTLSWRFFNLLLGWCCLASISRNSDLSHAKLVPELIGLVILIEWLEFTVGTRQMALGNINSSFTLRLTGTLTLAYASILLL